MSHSSVAKVRTFSPRVASDISISGRAFISSSAVPAVETEHVQLIETILKADLVLVDEVGFAPLDDTGAQLLFRFVAAAYERRALGIGSHWPFDQWGRFLPEHTTAVSLLDRLLHHAVVVVTEGESFRMRQARAKGGGISATAKSGRK